MIANKDNFFFLTDATFMLVKKPDREPDYESESGSLYWYTAEGVYRSSGHWGQCATCHWELDGYQGIQFTGYKTGFCKWENIKIADKKYYVYDKEGNSEEFAVTFDKMSGQYIVHNGAKIEASRTQFLFVNKE